MPPQLSTPSQSSELWLTLANHPSAQDLTDEERLEVFRQEVLALPPEARAQLPRDMQDLAYSATPNAGAMIGRAFAPQVQPQAPSGPTIGDLVAPMNRPALVNGQPVESEQAPAPDPRAVDLLQNLTQPTWGEQAAAMGIRTVPAVAGGALGGPVGAAIGGALGEAAAEYLVEGRDVNPWQAGVAGALNLVPGMSATGGATRLGLSAVENMGESALANNTIGGLLRAGGNGMLLSPVSTVGTNWAEGRPLTEHMGTNLLMGGAFGAATHGAIEAAGAAAPYVGRAVRQAGETVGDLMLAGDETGAVGDVARVRRERAQKMAETVAKEPKQPPSLEEWQRTAAPRDGQLPLAHGDVEQALDELFARNPNPTAEDLAAIPGAPRSRKGHEQGFDRDVRPIGWQEYKAAVLRGLPYVGWYRKFADQVRGVIGDHHMDEFANVFQVTSAQNPVETNLADTYAVMRAMRDPKLRDWLRTLDFKALGAEGSEQALKKAGEFFRANFKRVGLTNDGKPAKIKVTDDQVLRLARYYQTGESTGGMKTNTYGNTILSNMTGDYMPWTVQDVHAARSKGFRFRKLKDGVEIDDTRIPSEKSYRYAQYLDLRLAEELGVPPEWIQEAGWFTAKQELSSKGAEKWQHLKEHPDVAQGSYESAAMFAKSDQDALLSVLGDSTYQAPKANMVPTPDTGKSAALRPNDPATLPALREYAMQRGAGAVIGTKPGSAIILPDGVTTDDLVDFHHSVLQAIGDGSGKIAGLRALGIPHDIVNAYGTWTGVEPNFHLRLPTRNENAARFTAALLGDGLMQDAAVYSRPDMDGGTLAMRVEHPSGGEWSQADIEAAARVVNPTNDPKGVNFTVSQDRKGLEFLFFGDDASPMMQSWYNQLSKLGGAIKPFKAKGELLDSRSYGSVLQTEWPRFGAARRSDLPERFVDDLLRQPYLAEVAKRGWQVDLARFARGTRRSAADALAVARDGSVGSILTTPFDRNKPGRATPAWAQPSAARPYPFYAPSPTNTAPQTPAGVVVPDAGTIGALLQQGQTRAGRPAKLKK